MGPLSSTSKVEQILFSFFVFPFFLPSKRESPGGWEGQADRGAADGVIGTATATDDAREARNATDGETEDLKVRTFQSKYYSLPREP